MAKHFTGRYVVVYKDEPGPKSIKNFLNKKAGIKDMATTSDFDNAVLSEEVIEDSKAVFFERLGIGVISRQEEVLSLVSAISDTHSPILAIEPEYIAYLSPAETICAVCEPGPVFHSLSNMNYRDNEQFTWGLQATGVHTSKYSGRGINLAFLDTGFDLDHPDFMGRAIATASFSGVPVKDINGHGTRCAGTACGPKIPTLDIRRYGIAYNAHIYIGKVFDNAVRPGAPTHTVLAGIEWALEQGCQIASLSLGVIINQKIRQYEILVRRALQAGMLVVAAAGNNAQRPQYTGFVEPPANADASLAVGAVDNNLKVAGFSARSSIIAGAGGKVNIAAPGVNIFSSVPSVLGKHNFFSGTSMATPHVAGIAALYAEATGETRVALWDRLLQTARRLGESNLDVGSGLVQAP